MHRTNIISLIVMTALLFIVLLALEPQIGPRISCLRAEPKSSLSSVVTFPRYLIPYSLMDFLNRVINIFAVFIRKNR